MGHSEPVERGARRGTRRNLIVVKFRLREGTHERMGRRPLRRYQFIIHQICNISRRVEDVAPYDARRIFLYVPKAHLNVASATHRLCEAHTSYAVRRTSFAKQHHFGEAALYI